MKTIRLVTMGVLAIMVMQGAWGARLAEARARVLDRVLADARTAAKAGIAPAVVMDLDETVIDSAPRRRVALLIAAERRCDPALGAIALGPEACEAIRGLNTQEIYRLRNRYDDLALFASLGLDLSPDQEKRLLDDTLGEYLSGRLEGWDQPIAGANAFVRELRASGARVYFVSSRYEDAQLASTQASLRELGMLPATASRDLILRSRAMASIDFKRQAFARIRAEVSAAGGSVVGVFENEPENLQAMAEAFPGAAAVFVKGAWIKPGTVPAIARAIDDYR